jgi:AraC-like DNA-binding protein
LPGLLNQHACLASSDVDEVRTRVGRLFCDHALQVVGQQQRLDARLYARRTGNLVFGRMRYGAEVDINPGALNDFYLLQLPLQGQETVHAGGHTVLSTPATASLISPTQRFHMRHGQGTEKLFIRIERHVVQQQFQQLHGQAPQGAIEFLPGIALQQGAGPALRRLVDWLFAEADAGGLFDQPLVAAQLESTLLTTLLTQLPHNQAGPSAATAKAMTIAPRSVRRAQAYIEAHSHEPMTASRTAAQAGVSTRSLFAGFRKTLDTTPMAWLRDHRLDKVHAELRGVGAGVAVGAAAVHGAGSGPGTGLDTSGSAVAGRPLSVTAVAVRWGFAHLGQFAAAYRRRFGELPSQTLARHHDTAANRFTGR